jgi:hypothetical protein
MKELLFTDDLCYSVLCAILNYIIKGDDGIYNCCHRLFCFFTVLSAGTQYSGTVRIMNKHISVINLKKGGVHWYVYKEPALL